LLQPSGKTGQVTGIGLAGFLTQTILEPYGIRELADQLLVIRPRQGITSLMFVWAALKHKKSSPLRLLFFKLAGRKAKLS
jgi:hypothetical protein